VLGQGLSSMLMDRPTQGSSDAEPLRRPMNFQGQQMQANVGYVGSPSQKVRVHFVLLFILTSYF